MILCAAQAWPIRGIRGIVCKAVDEPLLLLAYGLCRYYRTCRQQDCWDWSIDRTLVPQVIWLCARLLSMFSRATTKPFSFIKKLVAIGPRTLQYLATYVRRRIGRGGGGGERGAPFLHKIAVGHDAEGMKNPVSMFTVPSASD